jgi:hypothetical protein
MSDVTIATEHQAEAKHCRNCGTFLGNPLGKFCPNCGQDTLNHPPTFFEFVHEFITHYVALEGKLWKTLWLLFFKPAELTREYRSGRKQRYISPLRLYITASFLFFLVVKIAGLGSLVKFNETDAENLPKVPNTPALNIKSSDEPVTTPRAKSSGSDATPAKAGPSTRETFRYDSSDTEALQQSVKREVDGIVKESKAVAEKAAADGKAAGEANAENKKFANLECGTGDSFCKRLENRINSKFRGKSDEALLSTLKDSAMANVPYAMFLLMPLFALLTKLIYINRGYYYGEHVVYALHIHAFTFFAMLLMAITPSWLTVWLAFAAAIYYLVALQRYFGGRWWVSMLRYMVIGTLYPFLLSVVALIVIALVVVS